MNLVRISSFALLAMLLSTAANGQETEPVADPAEPAVEESKPVDHWIGSAELSFVSTSGNTDSSSLGLGAELSGEFELWDQKYRARMIEVETEGEKTAESIDAGARIDRALREDMSLFGEVSYLRNRFAGIENRYAGATGVAWKVVEDAVQTLDLNAGVGYVQEERLDIADASFATAVAASAYKYAFSERSHFSNQTNLELSLEEGDNWRGRNIAAFVAGLTDIFALKLAVDVSYFNEPVPGFEKTDTITSAAIVAQF